MTKISFTVPIITVSEANSSEHWLKKGKRHTQQQWFIRLAFRKHVIELRLPCKVTMVRLAPRSLDDDNLCSAFKWIRDELSECIFPDKRKSYVTKKGQIKTIKGRADCDPRVSWAYAQEKNPILGIRIEFEFE